MTGDLAISVQNVSKYYEIYSKPAHRLLQMAFRGKRQFYRPFWARQNISFDVRKGECVGIIGKNGAGKSTLLQIMAGTLAPSRGALDIRGRVAALLELGSGFNPEFTGRENVRLNAAILGLSQDEIDQRFDSITRFAEIGDFLDQPVKSYSSGMVLRLAFAVIAHVDADILIIDEALAVGDAFFTQKCMRFLRRFMEDRTVVFVSHDITAVMSLCSRAILLENGKITHDGPPRDAARIYMKEMYAQSQGNVESTSTASERRAPVVFRDMRKDMRPQCGEKMEVFHFAQNGETNAGSLQIDARLTDDAGRGIDWVEGECICRLFVSMAGDFDLNKPVVAFVVRNSRGQEIFGDNTFLAGELPPLTRTNPLEVVFRFRMPILPPGDYFISVALAGANDKQPRWRHEATRFTSQTSSVCTGMAGMPMLEIDARVEG